MKLISTNITEGKQMIENTTFFFERTFHGFWLCKLGLNVAYLTEVSEFIEFEDGGVVYVAAREHNKGYGIYRVSNGTGRPERIVTISGGKRGSELPDRFVVELKLGDNSYFLSNLEFDKTGPTKGYTAKFKTKRYTSNYLDINVGDSDIFKGLTVFEGKKVVRYEMG